MTSAWLRDQLTTYFNKSELQNLCYDLGIKYESLPGETLEDKTRELVAYCHRHGHIASLLKRCQEIRPHVVWQRGTIDPDPSQRKLREIKTKNAALERELNHLKKIVYDILGKKPAPVLNQRWLHTKAQIYLVTALVVRAVISGARPPFDELSDQLQSLVTDYSLVTINWDSIVIEEPDVIFCLGIQVDGEDNTNRIWVRAGQFAETTGSIAEKNLEQLLDEALNETWDDTKTSSNIQVANDIRAVYSNKLSDVIIPT